VSAFSLFSTYYEGIETECQNFWNVTIGGVGRTREGRFADHVPPVLIVEDDRVSAAVITQLLASLGLANDIVVIGDGNNAITWLDVRRDPAGGPALVLLDLELPGCSGLAVLRWMRGPGGYARTPVVMLTGSSELGDITEAYALGIASYLVKPVAFDALSDIVRGLPLRWAILGAADG
jgi:CheY-like chemotaxis protein